MLVRDGQTLAGGVHWPIGFGQMLYMSESNESMQDAEIANVIAAKAGCGWAGNASLVAG